jgi:hypothetical protein
MNMHPLEKASKEESSWSNWFLVKLANLALLAAASDRSLGYPKTIGRFFSHQNQFQFSTSAQESITKTTKPISVPLLSSRVARSVLHHIYLTNSSSVNTSFSQSHQQFWEKKHFQVVIWTMLRTEMNQVVFRTKQSIHIIDKALILRMRERTLKISLDISLHAPTTMPWENNGSWKSNTGCGTTAETKAR